MPPLGQRNRRNEAIARRSARRQRRRAAPPTLISPITARGRKNVPRPVRFTRTNKVVKRGPRPVTQTRTGSRPVPVSPIGTSPARAARHRRHLAAHRRRVQKKQFREYLAWSQAAGQRERTALTHHYRPEVVRVPSQGDPYSYNGPKGSVLRDLQHLGGSALGKVLHLTGHDAATVVRQGTTHSATGKALANLVLHPGRTGGKLISGRQKLDLANASTPANATDLPNKLLIQTPKALIEHPAAIGKTLKGLAEIPLALPGGALQAAADPIGAAKGMYDDAKRRYGESDKEFRDRIGKEGAAAEVADASVLFTGSSASLGRGITSASRHFPGSRTAKFLTADRPKLRTSGGTARAQDLSPNAIRATAQRGEDAYRRRRVIKANKRHPDRKPGLQPQAHEVVPVFQKRAQRIEASRVQSPHYHAAADERALEINRGVHRGLNRLNRRQRHPDHGVVGHAVQGLVPLQDPVKAVRMLKARRKRIVAEYRRQFNRTDGEPREVKTIDYLIKHADDVFNEQLAKFHAEEVARHGRIGHVGTGDLTAEVRRRRPQADELGVQYDYEVAQNAIEQRAYQAKKRAKDANGVAAAERTRKRAIEELEQRKPQIDRQFIQKVDAARQDAGLPEPLYMEHFEHRTDAESKMGYTVAQARAMSGPKETQLILHRGGRADTRPIAYVQSVARTIRRKHNWRLVADAADAHSFRMPDAAELEEVFGHRHVDPEQLTTREWKSVLEHRGVKESDYAFWSPGRFQRQVTGHAATDSSPHLNSGEVDGAEVQHALNESLVPINQLPEGFEHEQGVRLISRAVYDEIHSAVKDSSLLGRAWGKVQGGVAAAILANPTFVPVQFTANAFVATAGLRGNVTAFFKSPFFWRRLSPEERQLADQWFGTGVGEAHGRNVHIGAAANNRIVDGYRVMREALAFKVETFKNAIPLVRNLPTLNPIQAMFALDNVQNRYFKRTVLYNEIKRQAFRDMAEHGGTAHRLQGHIAGILSLGPEERMRAIINNRELFEKHAQATNNFLGDYSRYTARERRYLKRNFMFYGFLRYSLRTLFYTMPVKHPVMGAVAAKLATFHEKEIRDLLGDDVPPYVLAKFYLGVHYDAADGKFKFDDPDVASGKKKPRSIDLGRINPIANAPVEALSEGPKAFAGLLSPVIQITFNQVYGKNAFTGTPYADTDNRALIALNEALSINWAYRTAERTTQPGPARYYQQDTTLFDARPKKYKTDAKRHEQRKAFRDAATPLDTLKENLIPFAPKADDSLAQAKKNRKKKPKSKSGGGNLFAPSGSGGGAGSF